MKVLRWFLSWLAAVVVTAAIGSVIQTQINIARISGLGVEVTVWQRFVTTGQDLLGFAPLWGIIVAAGLLVALLVAGGLARRWPAWSVSLHVLAGLAAPTVALLVMDAMLPVTVVAAARSWGGLVLMSLPGGLGGWLYVALLQRQKGQIFHQAAQRKSSSQAGS
jgi:hypothetical protein